MQHLPTGNRFSICNDFRANMIALEIAEDSAIWSRTESHRADVCRVRREKLLNPSRCADVPDIAMRENEMREAAEAFGLQKRLGEIGRASCRERGEMGG